MMRNENGGNGSIFCPPTDVSPVCQSIDRMMVNGVGWNMMRLCKLEERSISSFQNHTCLADWGSDFFSFSSFAYYAFRTIT